MNEIVYVPPFWERNLGRSKPHLIHRGGRWVARLLAPEGVRSIGHTFVFPGPTPHLDANGMAEWFCRQTPIAAQYKRGPYSA